MKKIATALLLTVLFCIHAYGQSSTMTAIHEDIVKPSMDATYRELMGKLNEACKQHKIAFSWTSVAYDDNSYVHLSPIKSFADLDKNSFEELETKMGKDALAKLFLDFDACIESHRDFVSTSLPQFSYLPPETGDNYYREILFWYVEPGKDEEAEKTMMEWKTLSETRKVPNGYSVNKLIFGSEPVYTFITWAKDPVDLATKAQKRQQLIGEEGGKLWAKTMLITKRYYFKEGWVLPQYSYSSSTK